MDNSLMRTLPAEIRNEIYKLVCPFATQTISLKELNTHTALLRTCKEIRNEAIPIFNLNRITKVALHFDTMAPPADQEIVKEQHETIIYHLKRVLRAGNLASVHTVDLCFEDKEDFMVTMTCIMEVASEIFITTATGPHIASFSENANIYSLIGIINRG